MSVAWFRKPDETQAGTLNASYQLLDRAVVAGRAEEPALPGLDHANLLERVGAFAGVLRGFGQAPGDTVVLDLPDGEDLVVALLAAVRLGVVPVLVPSGRRDLVDVLDSAAPGVVVTDDGLAVSEVVAGAEHRPGAVIVRGESLGEAVSWDVVMRAGRTDPAGAADLAPGAPGVLVWPTERGGRALVRSTGDLAERLAGLGAPYDVGVLLEAFRGA